MALLRADAEREFSLRAPAGQRIARIRSRKNDAALIRQEDGSVRLTLQPKTTYRATFA